MTEIAKTFNGTLDLISSLLICVVLLHNMADQGSLPIIIPCNTFLYNPFFSSSLCTSLIISLWHTCLQYVLWSFPFPNNVASFIWNLSFDSKWLLCCHFSLNLLDSHASFMAFSVSYCTQMLPEDCSLSGEIFQHSLLYGRINSSPELFLISSMHLESSLYFQNI